MEFTRKHTLKSGQSLPKITERSLKWLTFLNRHGPLSSQYLYEYSRETHRCKDTALRQMRTLCEQGVLFRPTQQLNYPNAPFNPYLYDVTDKGLLLLNEIGIEKNPARPTGHFKHLHLTASVTASIELEAMKAGNTYIEANEILALKNASLAVPLPSRKLIPDQLFAIKMKEGFRAFALEVDRGTEPIISSKMRKSYKSSIGQYCILFEQGLAKSHYGLTAPLTSIWVFTSRSREQAFNSLLSKCASGFANRFDTFNLNELIWIKPGGATLSKFINELS